MVAVTRWALLRAVIMGDALASGAPFPAIACQVTMAINATKVNSSARFIAIARFMELQCSLANKYFEFGSSILVTQRLQRQ